MNFKMLSLNFHSALTILGLITLTALSGSDPVAIAQQDSLESQQFLQRKERWAVKTGADPQASKIDVAKPVKITVADLIKKPRPTALLPATKQNPDAKAKRYPPIETSSYTIDADIIRYKLKDEDHDFHIVIRDHGDTKAESNPQGSPNNRTLIGEVPDPSVVSVTSPWKKQLAAVRTSAQNKLKPTTTFTRKVIHAQVTGVGFFDFDHRQSGRAPNIVELHPLTKIEFLP